jgi:hypothetical protein
MSRTASSAPIKTRSKAPKPFDYGALPPSDAADLRDRAERIRRHTHAAVVEVGRDLLAAKARVGHGCFQTWVEADCQLSLRTAERAMCVAEFVDKNDKLSFLPPDGLLALASPSAPEGTVTEILERIKAGQRPTAADIKREIKAASATEQAARDPAADLDCLVRMLHEAFGDRIPELIKELQAVRTITLDELADALRDRLPDIFEQHDRQDAASPPAVVAEFIAEDPACLSITVSTEVERVPMPDHDGNPRVEHGDELGPDDQVAKNASSSGNSDCNPVRVGEGRTKPRTPSDGTSAADDVTVHTGASAIESGDGWAEPTAKDSAEMNALFVVNEAVETAGVMVPCNDEAGPDPHAAGHDGMPPSNEAPFNSAASDGAGPPGSSLAPDPGHSASVDGIPPTPETSRPQPARPPATTAEEELRNLWKGMDDQGRERDRKLIARHCLQLQLPKELSKHMRCYLKASPPERSNHRGWYHGWLREAKNSGKEAAQAEHRMVPEIAGVCQPDGATRDPGAPAIAA